MDFGTIKDIFAQQIIGFQLNENTNGKDIYKNFIKNITENEVLKTQFVVYKNIENKTLKSEVSALNYIKENLSLLEKFNKKEIRECNKSLLNLLKESNIDYSQVNRKEIHKHIENLVISEKTLKTVDGLQESYDFLINHVTTIKNDITKNEFVKENIDPNKFLESAVKYFNEEYSELNEEEKTVIKTLYEGDNSSIKSLKEKLIKENIGLINTHLKQTDNNITLKSKLLETKDVVYGMFEVSDNKESIIKLLELKKDLSYDS
jgi:hypothetical protein